MAVLSRAATVACALLAGACYSPQISECTVRCGSDGACPSGLTCAADDFCHADRDTLCDDVADGPLGIDGQLADARLPADAPVGAPDAPRGIDAPVGAPDAPIGAPDAPQGTPDAPGGNPDAPPSCVTVLEDIDTEGTPQMGDISLGPDGTLHVTYVRQAVGELWYARKSGGGGWHLERVDSAVSVKKGQFLDAAGGLHVAYSDFAFGITSLWYEHLAPAAATWSVPDPVTDVGSPIDATITVDPLAKVHIAYYAGALGILEHATPNAKNDGWVIDDIDTGGTNGDVGEYPSIAYHGPLGRLFVSYADVANETLKLASRNGGTWTPRTIDATAGVGAFSSLAIDASGGLNIAYADATAGTLRYMLIDQTATNVVRLLADGAKSGRWNAIGLDPQGGVHISTFAFGDADLHVTYRPPNGLFTAAPVETAGSIGRFTGIAVDGLGGAHVVYTDDTHGILRHAYVCPPTVR